MPQQQIVPTFAPLNNANFISPTGLTDGRLGQAIGSGLNVGDYFDLTEAEALSLSYTVTSTLHAGRYRFVQVDANANAANVKAGTIGFYLSSARGPNVVTDYAHAAALTLRRCVFLCVITPGTYGWIQELGTANVLGGAAIQKGAPAIGDLITVSTTSTNGTVDDTTAQTPSTVSLGYSVTLPVANALFLIQMSIPEWIG